MNTKKFREGILKLVVSLEKVATILEEQGGFESTVSDIRDAIAQAKSITTLMGDTDNLQKDLIIQVSEKIKILFPYIKLLLYLNKSENVQPISDLLHNLNEWIKILLSQ